jgi:hypothetical protein
LIDGKERKEDYLPCTYFDINSTVVIGREFLEILGIKSYKKEKMDLGMSTACCVDSEGNQEHNDNNN